MGHWLIKIGVALVVIGAIVMLAERLGIHPGRLPGDIRIAGRHGVFYFPIVTCLVVSALLSLVGWIFRG